MSLWGSLPQALVALPVARTNAPALSIAIVGASVPLGIAGALYAVPEAGEGYTIGEAATILCGGYGDGLGVASRTRELVEVLCAELVREYQNFGLVWNDRQGPNEIVEGKQDVHLAEHCLPCTDSSGRRTPGC